MYRIVDRVYATELLRSRYEVSSPEKPLTIPREGS